MTAILIIWIFGASPSADHIEFNSIHQCEEFRLRLPKERFNLGVIAKCIEVDGE